MTFFDVLNNHMETIAACVFSISFFWILMGRPFVIIRKDKKDEKEKD